MVNWRRYLAFHIAWQQYILLPISVIYVLFHPVLRDLYIHQYTSFNKYILFYTNMNHIALILKIFNRDFHTVGAEIWIDRISQKYNCITLLWWQIAPVLLFLQQCFILTFFSKLTLIFEHTWRIIIESNGMISWLVHIMIDLSIIYKGVVTEAK